MSENPFDKATEMKSMLVTYAKQETIEPLKSLGRYFAFGAVGSLFIALGIIMCGLGVLRGTQSIDALGGKSWASLLPYVITLVSLLIAVAIISMIMKKAKNTVK